MKALKVILLILVVVFGAYCIWMATIPADYKVERSTVINTGPAPIYATVSDFKTWPEWSPWFERDTTMKAQWGEQTSGEGAEYSWTSTNSGNGSQSITAVTPNEAIETHIVFEGMGESDGYWQLEPVDDSKTKVTWGFEGSFPFLFRVFSLGMDEQVGNDFEKGLANLKEVVESMPKAPKAVEITLTEVEPVAYYSVTDDVSFSDMSSEFFAVRYQELGDHLKADMQNMNGAPFAIYHKWDTENEMATVEVAVPVSSEKAGNDRVKKGETYTGTVLKSVYMGPYEGTGDVHNAMHDYTVKNNMQIVGSPWEVYVTDPSMEPDNSKWITEIYYPVMPADAQSASMDESKASDNG